MFTTVLGQFKRVRVAVPVAIGLALVGIAGFQLWQLNTRTRWAVEDALPEIVHRITVGDHFGAFTLAEEAEEVVPEHPLLGALWPRMSVSFSITTEPAGADISFKHYRAIDGEWTYLGQSPQTGIRFPIGAYRLEITKAGYETVYTVVATPEAASDGPGARPDSVHFNLAEAGTVPATMVAVAPVTARLSVRGLWHIPALDLPLYYMDKFEVTNARFKGFIDAGGYENRDYWKHEFRAQGRTLTWEEAMARFRDGSGNAGPSTWEAGTYPTSEENHPVSGVSWFEAAAYAEFAERSLPTIYHWSADNRPATDAGLIVPFSNYRGTATAPAGHHPGIGRLGVYDQAGNVREWIWNATDESGDARYLLGGAWNDAGYAFTNPLVRSPWDRSPENGLRTVRYPFGAQTVPDSAFLAMQFAPGNSRSVTSLSDAAFQAYKEEFYSYEARDLDAIVELVEDGSPLWRREKITFNAAYGDERVIAYLFLPRAVEPPYQTVVYFPTGLANRPSPSDSIGRRQGWHDHFWEFLVLGGRAVMYTVYDGTYDRQNVGGNPLRTEEAAAHRDWLVRLAKDVRRSVDYLETRQDIARAKLAYYGVSFGANEGPRNLAVEDRFRAGVFLIGGFPRFQLLPEVDLLSLAPHVEVPVLTIAGDQDYSFPSHANLFPIFEALGVSEKDKELRVHPGGHGMWGLLGHEVRQEISEWLDRYLGAVKLL